MIGRAEFAMRMKLKGDQSVGTAAFIARHARGGTPAQNAATPQFVPKRRHFSGYRLLWSHRISESKRKCKSVKSASGNPLPALNQYLLVEAGVQLFCGLEALERGLKVRCGRGGEQSAGDLGRVPVSMGGGVCVNESGEPNRVKRKRPPPRR